jgi:hypothetical protein
VRAEVENRGVHEAFTPTFSFRSAIVGLVSFAWVGAGNSVGAPVPIPPESGLVLWLCADDRDADGETDGPVSDGTRVSVWQDKSQFGNDVAQDAVDRQPRLVGKGIGEKSVLRFSGSGLQRDKLSGFQSGEQRFQVFVVMRAAPQESGSPRLLDLPTHGTKLSRTKAYTLKRKGFWLGYYESESETAEAGKLSLGVHVGGEGAARTVAWDGEPHLLDSVYAGNQRWAQYLAGAPDGRGRFVGDTGFVGYDGGARLAVGQVFGSNDPATAFRGDVAAILIYNRVLTADEQAQVGTFLGDRYGIRASYANPTTPPRFESDIVPILKKNCLECHSGDKPEGSLRLGSMAALLHGGVSGPVLVRGHSTESHLLHMVATNEMPPPDEALPLSDSDVETIRRWIESGAPADEKIDASAVSQNARTLSSEHWAFQTLRPTKSPDVGGGKVDAFIGAKLREKGLDLSPQADPETLIRRAHLDVVGLPPSPKETNAFVSDPSEEAWEKLIDRLLKSPHFGERWGRHWLDGAGYSDTIPLDNDQHIVKPGPGKWKYRDYVVRSFNEDKPFDQFLIEQLAGDELVAWREAPRFTPKIRDHLVATGFLRCSSDVTDENELNTLVTRFGILHRTGESVGANLLALTVQCCKCHDHKFEPVSQRDYFRFSAIFAPAWNPKNWRQPSARQVIGLGSEERAEIDRQIDQFSKRQRSVREETGLRLLDEKIAQLPADVRDAVKSALLAPEDQRSEKQVQLAKAHGKLMEKWDEQVSAALSDDEKRVFDECAAGIINLNEQKAAATIQAVYDVAKPSSVHVLRRGNFETPGAVVEPQLFQVLAMSSASVKEPVAVGETSGRRLVLARQLTDWSSPAGALVTRVRVNRIWQRLFGQGIVPSSDNFGVSGDPPSHPELLEWLAAEFVLQGGRTKPFLKELLTSAVYRQSSAGRSDRALEVDPENRLLWRQRLRRLDSEIIRDTMLSASGSLDPTIGGAPVGIENRPDGSVIEAGSADAPRRWRRSLYLLQRRNYHLSMLAAFDQPMMTHSCTRRDSSAVVSQSLMMLNDAFVILQAKRLAERVRQMRGSNSIENAFRLVLARRPSEDEMRWCGDAYARHREAFQSSGQDNAAAEVRALEQICHMLFNTSEFLYVD